MTASAHDIAVELRRRLPGLGVKKQHKLLYYCQGHHLATFGEPLFSEAVSAWDMGPVVGQLWKEEKEGGPRHAQTSVLTEAQLNTVGYVVSRYGALSGADLERLTHSETPWPEADRRREPGSSARIEHSILHAFFSQDKDDDDAAPLPDSDSLLQWLRGVKMPTGDAPADSIDDLLARARG